MDAINSARKLMAAAISQINVAWLVAYLSPLPQAVIRKEPPSTAMVVANEEVMLSGEFRKQKM